ncbi:MAG TPA: HAMP domain-containing sensor histidine kinase [Flavobacteriales bacterium]|nr:HAMP domain-containing sensor histidine kinase [Flavobacteriales bacterium]HMR27067.1 HAMP domain-containing sensor histidine kinase [Flavobacteriales bacterium]
MASQRLIGLLGLLLALGPALNAPAQRYAGWRHFTNRNGLPQSSVGDMAWDEHGFLWLTTQGGLARCDGRFVRAVPMNGASPPRPLVHLLRTTTGGLFTIGASGEVHRLRTAGPLPLTTTATTPPHPSGTMPSERQLLFLLRTAARNGWTGLRTCALDSASWLLVQDRRLSWWTDTVQAGTLELPAPPLALFGLPSGAHVVSADGSVSRFDPDTGTLLPVTLDPAVPPGGRWFEQAGRPFVLHLRDGRLQLYREVAANGAISLQGTPIDVDPAPPSDVAQMLFDGTATVLATSTVTQGLFLHHRQWFNTRSCADPDLLGGNSFYGQAELPDGLTFTVDHQGSGVLLDGAGCRPAPAPLNRLDPFSLARDRTGGLYIKSRVGIERFDPATGRSTAVANSTDGRTTMVLEKDTLWAVSRSAFGLVRNDSIHWSVVFEGLEPGHDPVTLCRASDGRWWFGTCDGAFVLGSEPVQRPVPVAGLMGSCVRALHRWGDLMLVGTYGQGAFVHDGRSLRRLPMDERGALMHTHAFAPDALGALWISTNNGLLRTTWRDLEAWVADSTQRPFMGRFDEEDGLMGSELNGGCVPAYLTLSTGELSFPSMRGLVRFDPATVPDPWPGAPLQATALKVDGVAIPLGERVTLPADHGEVVLQYALAHWGNASQVQLELRLEGLQEGWTLLASDRDEVRLGLLPPGETRLVLRKVGGALRGEPEAFAVLLSVPLPWYRSWWAGLGFVSLGALVGLALHRWNLLRLRAANTRLGSLVKARTQALSTANEDLKAALHHQEKLIAIIAHDLVHPLRFVSRVARDARVMHERREDPGELGLTLQDLEGATRKLFTNASDLLGWVRSRHVQDPDRRVQVDLHRFVGGAIDRIAELSGTIDLRNEVSAGTQVTTDPDVLAIVLNNLLMNAVVHGRARCITLDLADHPGIVLRVRDDGTGMSLEQLDRIRKELEGLDDGHGRAGGTALGLGYVIISECMRLLHARATIDSGPGGTTVELALPSA